MCSGKFILSSRVMATAVLTFLLFATVGTDRVLRLYEGSHHVANSTTTTTTAVLENSNTQETESYSTDALIDTFSFGLRTHDLIAAHELKNILIGWIICLSKVGIFPILMAHAQPQRHFHRLRWHPYIVNNALLRVRHFPGPGPRVQPVVRDQLVPEMDDIHVPQRSQPNDHLVPVVDDSVLPGSHGQQGRGVREADVPGWPGENQPVLPLEEPPFMNLAPDQVVPQDGPLPSEPATHRREVTHALLHDLERIFSLPTGTAMPWAEALAYIFGSENETEEDRLERLRSQSQVLESMPTLFLFCSHNNKYRRV